MSGKPSLDAMPAGTTSGTPQVDWYNPLKYLLIFRNKNPICSFSHRMPITFGIGR